jgi:hypothetical protein
MGSIKIVTERSAILGAAREIKTSVNANHQDLCKFKGPGDAAYTTVRQVIRDLITEITPLVTARDAGTQPSPPPDLKYANLTDVEKLDGDSRNYPVLVWGKYTYWGKLCFREVFNIY